MDMSQLLFLLAFVPACALHLLPGAVLLRRRDWGWAAGCLALGAAGILLFLPWVAAVVIAARRARFTPLKQGSPLPVLCRILGVGLALLAGVLISWGIRDYRQAAEISMMDFYADIIINSIMGCVGLLIAGILLLIIPSLRGKGLWGGLMAAPVLLGMASGVRTDVLLLFVLTLITLIAELGLAALVLAHTVPSGTDLSPAPEPSLSSRPVPASPAPVSRPITTPPTARLRCVAGQYAGAEFPLTAGETLCLGSSPDLAHLVFSQSGVAPLHGEITYQRARGVCLLTHGGPVFLNDRELPQICDLHSGDIFSFGTPRQSFQVLI